MSAQIQAGSLCFYALPSVERCFKAIPAVLHEPAATTRAGAR